MNATVGGILIGAVIAAGAVGAAVLTKKDAPTGPSVEVVARLDELETERADLQKEIERLQGAVADAERMALENRREHQQLSELVDDFLGFGGPSSGVQARTSGEPAEASKPAGEAVASGGASSPRPVTQEMIEFAAAAEVAPERAAEIQAVLAQIEAKKREERRVREDEQRQERSLRMVQQLTERLRLNPDQEQAFSKALYARDRAMSELWGGRRGRGDGEADGQQMTREEMQALSDQVRQDYENELTRVLDPVQYQGLLDHRAEREGGGRQRGRRGE
ncbi:MAG: hypothetical protein ACYS22_00735 [Planctomycetota bacterium]|jgi:hypothetical protein